ncbi:unnamed protein product [Heterobilharzia americana]|nr:unnamed protein product [Heterobilharzia americana]
MDLVILPGFSQSTITSSIHSLYPYQHDLNDKLNKYASRLNSRILETLTLKIKQLDKKIDLNLKDTYIFYENQFIEEQRILRQHEEEQEYHRFNLSGKQLTTEEKEEHERQEEILMENKRLAETFDEHVNIRKKLRAEEILAKYKIDPLKTEDKDLVSLPEVDEVEQVMDTINSDEFEVVELSEQEEEPEEEDLHGETTTYCSVHSRILPVHDLIRESVGLERNSKITHAFVWSYFELLRKMRTKLLSPVHSSQEGEDRTNSSFNITV